MVLTFQPSPPVTTLSVIVPTFDRPVLLREALRSNKAHDKPGLRLVLIVCDNGLKLENRQAAEEFGARYIPVQKKGAGAARNAGLRAAEGDYIAFLDDDDVWLPAHIEPHLSLLAARPDLDAVIGQVISTDAELKPVSEPWPLSPPGEGDALLKKMMSGYFPQIGTLVARRGVIGRFGAFDEALIGGQDLDWMLRIAGAHKLGFVPVPCVLFRGRNGTAFYALQLSRIRYDRRVFLRHALRHRRVWRSPFDFARAYASTVRHYFDYFSSEALSRAHEGKRFAALKAMRNAASVLPFHAAYHVVARRPLRYAMALTIKSVGSKKLAPRV